MRLPVDVRDLMKSGSQLSEERERPVRIAVFVEVDAPDELVAAVQKHLHPHTANASLHIEVAEPGTKLLADSTLDAVIGVVGSGEHIGPSLKAARERAIPTVAIGLGDDSAELANRVDQPYRDAIADLDEERLVAISLGEWLAERVPGKRLAMAANYEFMRRAVAIEHVQATAFQNGVVGVVAFIPGADMPIMTANQAKMLLQIAAAYGETLGMERAKELLGVVGGAFVLRTIARQAVAFVPGFGWAIKGGIGYTGTIAMGYAAIKYFEGGELEDVKARLDEYGRRMGERLRAMSRKEARQIAADLDIPVEPQQLALEPADPASTLPASSAEESARGDA